MLGGEALLLLLLLPRGSARLVVLLLCSVRASGTASMRPQRD